MREVKLFFLIALLTLVVEGWAVKPSSLSEARDTYCATPPFLQEETYSNVMMVIDISGSMRSDAFKGSYNKNKVYKGFFHHDAYYACYDATEKKYINSDSCRNQTFFGWFVYRERYWVKIKGGFSKPYNKTRTINGIKTRSGNYLNQEYMKRIDVIRWVLTGGLTRTVAKTKVVTLYYGQNIKLEDTTTYNPKTLKAEGILQEIQRFKKKPRIGAYFFHGSGIESSYNVPLSYDYTTLINRVNTVYVSGSTPTKYALKDTRLFFSRKNGQHGGFRTSSSNYQDPYKFRVGNKTLTVSCAKNFVILLTDGEWNTGGEPLGEAYNMWKGGTADLVSNLKGKQNAKIYGIALFLAQNSGGMNAVKHISIFGGFNDIDGNKWPCAYSGLVNSKSSVRSVAGKSCRDEWDADKDNLPDTFAEGSEPDKVKDAIRNIFRKILNEVASGSSISALSGSDKQGTIMTQAVFYPQRVFKDNNKEYKVSWMGQLFSYWFLNTQNAQNLREDTNQNKRLEISKDKILSIYIDSNTDKLRVKLCTSDNDGQPTTTCSYKDSLDDIKYLWEAGEKLKNKSASTRRLFTVSDRNTLVSFTTANLSAFQVFLGTDKDMFPDCLIDSSNKIDYAKLVNYVRGVDYQGCRKRTVDNSGKVWKLADIIYSSPKVVYYEDYAVVFTASNDGILHAFKVGKVENAPRNADYVVKLTGTGLGEELWGFIPKNALPYLRFLADPEYCHMYMNDLPPYITKLDYDNDGTEELILIGGMRLAGGCGCSASECVNPPSDTCQNARECFGLSSYYALDITNPTQPKFLWEFSDPDLGFSYSGPAIIKKKVGSSWEYSVMFASGPTDLRGTSKQSLKLFFVKLDNGAFMGKIDVAAALRDDSFKNSFGGRLFNEGLDVNGDGETDFVLLGYTNKEGNYFSGGVLKIWIGSGSVDVKRLLKTQRPITSSIEVGNCFGKWYLFFGTGRYFAKDDSSTNPPLNSLYGVPFLCDENNNCPTGTLNVTHLSSSNKVKCQDVGTIRGAWRIELSRGGSGYLEEKNISDPTLAENIVFFLTSQPTSDVCGYGGRNRAWAMNCALGESISSTRCSAYKVSAGDFLFLWGKSGGDIGQASKSDFNQVSNRATSFSAGIAPEKGGFPIFPAPAPGSGEGTILLWIER